MKEQKQTFTKRLNQYEKLVLSIGWTKFHNQDAYFSMTADLYDNRVRSEKGLVAGGCLHDEIKTHFPEFAHLIKYHLVSTSQPMHYVANALYHASDKDCWGYNKGEPSRFETHIFFNDVPIPYKIKNQTFIKWLQDQDFKNLEIQEIGFIKKNNETYDFKPKYTFLGFGSTWYDCLFDSRDDIEAFKKALLTCKVEFKRIVTKYGEGKEPDIDAARSCAIWPDAQLSDFTKENLEKRLPELMKQFRNDLDQANIPWYNERG